MYHEGVADFTESRGTDPTPPSDLTDPPSFGQPTETVVDALIEALERHFAAAGVEGRAQVSATPTLLKYASSTERSPYETFVRVLGDHADVGERLPAIAVTSASGTIMQDTHTARVLGTFRWPPRLTAVVTPGLTPFSERASWRLATSALPADLTALGVTWTVSPTNYALPDELRPELLARIEDDGDDGDFLVIESQSSLDFILTSTSGTPERVSGPFVAPEVIALREARLAPDGTESQPEQTRLAVVDIEDEQDLRQVIEERTRTFSMRGDTILSRRYAADDVDRSLEAAPPRVVDLASTAAAQWRLAEAGTGGFEAGSTLAGGVLDMGVRPAGPGIDAAGLLQLRRPLYVVFPTGQVFRAPALTSLGGGRYSYGPMVLDDLSSSNSTTDGLDDLAALQPEWWAPQRTTTLDRGAFRRYELKADLSVQIEVFCASSNERRELTDLILAFFGFGLEPRRFTLVGRGLRDIRFPRESWYAALNSRITDGGRQEFPRPGSDAEKVHARRITVPLLYTEQIDRELTWSGENPDGPPAGTPLRFGFAELRDPGETTLVRPNARVQRVADPTVVRVRGLS